MERLGRLWGHAHEEAPGGEPGALVVNRLHGLEPREVCSSEDAFDGIGTILIGDSFHAVGIEPRAMNKPLEQRHEQEVGTALESPLHLLQKPPLPFIAAPDEGARLGGFLVGSKPFE